MLKCFYSGPDLALNSLGPICSLNASPVNTLFFLEQEYYNTGCFYIVAVYQQEDPPPPSTHVLSQKKLKIKQPGVSYQVL